MQRVNWQPRDVVRFRYSGKRVAAISKSSGRCADGAGDGDDANEPAGSKQQDRSREAAGKARTTESRDKTACWLKSLVLWCPYDFDTSEEKCFWFYGDSNNVIKWKLPNKWQEWHNNMDGKTVMSETDISVAKCFVRQSSQTVLPTEDPLYRRFVQQQCRCVLPLVSLCWFNVSQSNAVLLMLFCFCFFKKK